MSEFPDIPWPKRVIIAMKGLPCTAKSELADVIGVWARCPVLYIDDFLHTLSAEKGYSAKSLPSPEEAERLQRVAFDELCTAATRRLRYRSRCIVIKSRLSSTFELDLLVELAREIGVQAEKIIIIECQMKNEHRFRLRLDDKVRRYGNKEEDWFRPRSYKDIEKVREECDNVDVRAHWDRHLLGLLKDYDDQPDRVVVRLVLDPFNDLRLDRFSSLFHLTFSFQHVLKFLVEMRTRSEDKEELSAGWVHRRDGYFVVHFGDVRRHLVEKELQKDRERSSYLCATERGPEGKCCVFKYLPEGIIIRSDDSGSGNHIINCGSCEEPVDVSGQPAYSCYFCFLTLHKSCAELHGVDYIRYNKDYSALTFYPAEYAEMPMDWHACKSCMEERKGFSNTCKLCLYQTHIKSRLFPTIIHHDSHREHFLSLEVASTWNIECKACRDCCLSRSSYGCYICGLSYGMQCVFMPPEPEHTHGGHEHLLKLMYSHDHEDEEEAEESYWCEVCYKDIDPEVWFYSCQNCPFIAHPRCAVPFMYKGKIIQQLNS